MTNSITTSVAKPSDPIIIRPKRPEHSPGELYGTPSTKEDSQDTFEATGGQENSASKQTLARLAQIERSISHLARTQAERVRLRTEDNLNLLKTNQGYGYLYFAKREPDAKSQAVKYKHNLADLSENAKAEAKPLVFLEKLTRETLDNTLSVQSLLTRAYIANYYGRKSQVPPLVTTKKKKGLRLSLFSKSSRKTQSAKSIPQKKEVQRLRSALLKSIQTRLCTLVETVSNNPEHPEFKRFMSINFSQPDTYKSLQVFPEYRMKIISLQYKHGGKDALKTLQKIANRDCVCAVISEEVRGNRVKNARALHKRREVVMSLYQKDEANTGSWPETAHNTLKLINQHASVFWDRRQIDLA